MIGYATDSTAAATAKRTGNLGLTGSGQQCCPVQFPDGSWGFWTAHNYFHPDREPGEVLLPGGRLLDPTGDEFRALVGDGYESWMADAMFPVWDTADWCIP